MDKMKRMLAVLVMLVLVLPLTACNTEDKQDVKAIVSVGATVAVSETPVVEAMSQTNDVEIAKPWENGGKPVEEYTWVEFEALSPELQEVFFDSFESIQAFEEWRTKEQKTKPMQTEDVAQLVKPWENGGKATDEYTWVEFEALSPEQQEMFFDAFESVEAFDEWMQGAKN